MANGGSFRGDCGDGDGGGVRSTRGAGGASDAPRYARAGEPGRGARVLRRRGPNRCRGTEDSSRSRSPEGGGGLKRAVDIVISFAVLLVLAPVLSLVALAIWVSDGRSPFYRGARLARGGGEFRML